MEEKEKRLCTCVAGVEIAGMRDSCPAAEPSFTASDEITATDEQGNIMSKYCSTKILNSPVTYYWKNQSDQPGVPPVYAPFSAAPAPTRGAILESVWTLKAMPSAPE